MKFLNCFANTPNQRFVFKHEAEQPLQAPKPLGSAKKNSISEHDLKNPVDEAEAKFTKLRKRFFLERLDKVKELQKAMASFQEKSTANESDRKLIDEQMVAIGKQLNYEMGPFIDFTKLEFLDIGVNGDGFYMQISDNSVSFYIGFRPDGTTESRRDKPDRTISYYDTRTETQEFYGPLPITSVHISKSKDSAASGTEPSKEELSPEQQLLEEQRFEKNRAGRFWPSTE